MVSLRSFDDVHEALAKYVPPPNSIRQAYTLDRIRRLMDFLGNPQENYKTIHVAGTSGKTSTAYYLSSLLIESGQKVGLTVSPHIDEVNERVQIQNKPLSSSKYFSRLEKFLKLIEKSDVKPTYFELLVAFAYWVFAIEKVDYAVVEVGLGGLLDGTNVITRSDKVCVITDIGLDHTAILGKTLPEITAQKAGIIKPHNEVFMYEQDDAIMSVVREVCSQQQATFHEILPIGNKDLPKNLPLFQRRNWYLALSAFQFVAERDELNPPSEIVLANSTQTYIPARMEVLQIAGHTIILDGAHNAQKFKALVSSVKNQFPDKQIAILIGMVQGKGAGLQNNLRVLRPLIGHTIITAFVGQQDMQKLSIDPLKIAEAYDKLGLSDFEIIDDPEAAFNRLLARPETVLLVTGSFYLLNHIRPLLSKK